MGCLYRSLQWKLGLMLFLNLEHRGSSTMVSCQNLVAGCEVELVARLLGSYTHGGSPMGENLGDPSMCMFRLQEVSGLIRLITEGNIMEFNI